MRILILITSFLILVSCSNKEKEKVIFGRLRNAEKSWIYLQEITEKGDMTIDSVLDRR